MVAGYFICLYIGRYGASISIKYILIKSILLGDLNPSDPTVYYAGQMIGTLIGTVVGVTVSVFGTVAFGGRYYASLFGGLFGFIAKFWNTFSAFAEQEMLSSKSKQYHENKEKVVFGAQFYGIPSLVCCGIFATVIVSGDYGIYGSITGAIVALLVAHVSKRMYRILNRDAGPRVYMFCTGLGALSGGVSASMFGLVGLVFSTVAFVIAVPILSTRLNNYIQAFSTWDFWISTGFSTVIPPCYLSSSAYFATVYPDFCAASLLI